MMRHIMEKDQKQAPRSRCLGRRLASALRYWRYFVNIYREGE